VCAGVRKSGIGFRGWIVGNIRGFCENVGDK
jgi:hypothetical protein